MATFSSGQVSVSGSTAVAVVTPAASSSVYVSNGGYTDIYLGASGVTSATGAYLKPGQGFVLTIGATPATLYAISPHGRGTVTYLTGA
jgi:hypothetical protein